MKKTQKIQNPTTKSQRWRLQTTSIWIKEFLYKIYGRLAKKQGKAVIISCGKNKIWDLNPNAGPTAAKDVYVGNYVNKLKEYAKDQVKRGYADDWFIISAKYGIITKDFIIPEPYNVTFDDLSTNPISVKDLAVTVKESVILGYKNIEVIAGDKYKQRIEQVIPNDKLSFPFDNLKSKGQGYYMGWCKEQINNI